MFYTSYSYSIGNFLITEKFPSFNIDVGFNIKYLQSILEDEKATAFATEVGVQTKLSVPQIKLGLVIQNIGTRMKFIKESFPLPMNIKFGAGYSFLIKNNFLNLMFDINFPNDNDLRINFGAEYRIRFGEQIKFSPRIGYKSSTEGLEGIAGITAGVGFAYKDYCIDYAFVPYGQLGNTHRVSLSIAFGK